MCCGEDVAYNTIFKEEETEITCVYCGFILDKFFESLQEPAESIFIAEDSDFTRKIVEGMIVNKGLAKTVSSFRNGQEFISGFSKRLQEGSPPDLAILDLQMPEVTGITAARMMRALEEKYNLKKIPVIFFSASRCDEDLRKNLVLLEPSSYIHKGESAEELVDRIAGLVNHVLKLRKNL
jgi:CheY-like chemotaxis protein